MPEAQRLVNVLTVVPWALLDVSDQNSVARCEVSYLIDVGAPQCQEVLEESVGRDDVAPAINGLTRQPLDSILCRRTARTEQREERSG